MIKSKWISLLLLVITLSIVSCTDNDNSPADDPQLMPCIGNG